MTICIAFFNAGAVHVGAMTSGQDRRSMGQYRAVPYQLRPLESRFATTAGVE